MRYAFLLGLCLLFGIVAQAQSLPTIEFFTVDNNALNYPAVEAGTETANFSWRAVGLREGDRMQMHAWVGGQWALIGENFEAEKTDTLVIAHPLDFILPRYRLSVVGAGGQIAAEQILELNYAAPDGLPTITMLLPFVSSSSTTISMSAFDEPFHIQWRVTNRWFNSNLVFEQILPNGTVLNAEYERPSEWQYAHRADFVRIVYPGDYADVVLRLRVINRDDGSTLVQRDLVLAVNDSPAEAAELVHVSVTPELVNPGESVTLSWEVINTDVVFIEFYDGYTYGGCDVVLDEVYRDLPPIGSLEVTAPLLAFSGLRFAIFTDFYIGSTRHHCGSRLEPLTEITVDVTDYIGQGVESFDVIGDEISYATFGSTVTLTWEVSEGESVTIIQPDTVDTQFQPGVLPPIYEIYSDLPLSGTLEVTIPDDSITRSAISRNFLLYIVEDGVLPLAADASTLVLFDSDGDLDCDSFVIVEDVIQENGLLSPDVNITWDSCGNANTLLRFAVSNRGFDPLESISVEPSGTMTYRLPDDDGTLWIYLDYELDGERYRLQSTRTALPEG